MSVSSELQTVTVNGQPKSLPANCTVQQMLRELDIRTRGLAVEINQQLVSQDEFESTKVCDGDQVEIVTFVGGG